MLLRSTNDKRLVHRERSMSLDRFASGQIEWREGILSTNPLLPTMTHHRMDKGRLYGREEEQEELIEAFHRRGHAEIVLLTGPSGVGKTALARTLKPIVEKEGGYFCSGKFELSPEPYQAVVQVLTSWVQQQNDLTPQVRRVLEKDRVLVDLVPALQKYANRATLPTPGPQTQVRLKFQLQQFIREVDKPLVVFLDDLQWTDAATLDLLWAMWPPPPGLVFVGACRSNEMTLEHPLSVTLRQLEATNVSITDIGVHNLSYSAVKLMLRDVGLAQSAKEIYEHTEGNAFHVSQYIRSLQGKDLAHIVETRTSEDVSAVELVARTIDSLPNDARDAMLLASCMGTEIHKDILKCLVADVDLAMTFALDNALVEANGDGWRFVHDQVQQGAYSLIPENERDAKHLQIGQKLWTSLSTEDLDLHKFLVINQLERGSYLVENQVERNRIALHFLQAGEKAVQNSTFVKAASLLQSGIDLLGNRHWRDEYHLSLDLYNAAIEVEYCNGNFDRVEALVGEVLKHSRSKTDKIRAQTCLIYALATRGIPLKAIEVGRSVLKEYGVSLPKKGSVLRILSEYRKTKGMLKAKSDEEILSSTAPDDREHVAVVRVLSLLFPYLINVDPLLASSVGFRLVWSALEHGVLAHSSIGFAQYAMVLSNGFGDIEESMRYANLSLLILEKFQAREWIARAYPALYGFCFCWMKPKEELMPPLLEGHRLGLATGDIEFSTMCGATFVAIAAHQAVPLDIWVAQAEGFHSVANLHHQANVAMFLLPSLQLGYNLMGRAPDSKVLSGNVLDFDTVMAKAHEDKNATVSAILHLLQLMLGCFLRKYAAVEHHIRALDERNSGKETFPPFCLASLALCSGIVSSELTRSGRRRQRLRVVRRSVTLLEKIAKYNPKAFASKSMILQAELLATKAGRADAARRLFDEAIDAALKSENMMDAAIACERTANLLRRQDKMDDANSYIDKARQHYQVWGATAVVQALLDDP